MATQKLNGKALGLAFGIIEAIGLAFLALWVMVFGSGTQLIGLFSGFAWGYGASTAGVILGLVYGFIDGFIGGWIIAWLYNKFA